MGLIFPTRLMHGASITDSGDVDVNTPNTSASPDVFFKFISHPSGLGYFSYVSENTPRLLGLSPRALCSDAKRLLELMSPEDQDTFLQSLELSRTTLLDWIWEGKITPTSGDAKHIRLRAAARSRMDGRVVWDGFIEAHSGLPDDALHSPLRTQDQLALLASQQTRAREDERLRIAQDLHDDVGGHLTGIKLQLALIQQKLSEDLKTLVAPQLSKLDHLIDRTIDSTRRLTSHLRPPILDLGLIKALEWLIDDFKHRANTTLSFQGPEALPEIPEDIQIGLFRICQESLNNAFKHAEASAIEVRLEANAHQIILEIRDNGVGFKKEDCRRSDAFGLSGMGERALQLGGRLEVESTPDIGTCIRLSIPG